MSLTAHHTVRQVKSLGTLLREAIERRTEERFHADVGAQPLTKEQAYQLGVDGPTYSGRWSRVRLEQPGLGADVLKAYEAGLAEYERQLDNDSYDAYGDDDWDDTDYGDDDWLQAARDADYIRNCKAWMHEDAEWTAAHVRANQMDAMWAFVEQGAHTPPLYMTRVAELTRVLS